MQQHQKRARRKREKRRKEGCKETSKERTEKGSNGRIDENQRVNNTAGLSRWDGRNK